MRSLIFATAIVVSSQAPPIAAQGPTATIRVQVRASEKPVENAVVAIAGSTHRTDAAGTAIVSIVPGAIALTVVKAGFAPATVSVQIAAGAVQDVVVELQPQPSVEETVTVVASTRTDKRLENQPMRVEVLLREEIPCFALPEPQTGDGPSTRGRRSKAATSTEESACNSSEAAPQTLRLRLARS